MTLTLELKPELETRLQEQAQRCGVSMEAMVERLVECSLPPAPQRPFFETATPEEWAKASQEWVDSHRHLPTMPPESFERAGFYEDR